MCNIHLSFTGMPLFHLLSCIVVCFLSISGYWRQKGETYWRQQIETFSALLALCEGNPPVTDGFPSQRPVTRSFDVLVDVCLNNRLSKQSRCRWFETPCRSLRRHYNIKKFLVMETTGHAVSCFMTIIDDQNCDHENIFHNGIVVILLSNGNNWIGNFHVLQLSFCLHSECIAR